MATAPPDKIRVTKTIIIIIIIIIKPDIIIIQEKDSERCLIIDVAIPSDYKISRRRPLRR